MYYACLGLVLNLVTDTQKNEQLDAMLSITCCNVVLHPVNYCCQQPLFTVVHIQHVHSIIIVQSLLTTISKLFSSNIVSSCPNNIVTTIVLCQHRTTIDRTMLINMSIQQVLLNFDNNIVVEQLFRRCSTNQPDQFLRV